MALPPSVQIPTPIAKDQPGLGYASQTWLPQVRSYQESTSGVALAQSATFYAGLAWYYPCFANAGNIQVNLPPAAGQWQKTYVFKKTDSTVHTVTISPNGVIPDTIDGNSSLVLTKQYQTAYIVCDGVSNWNVIVNNLPGLSSAGVPAPTILTSGSGNFTTSATTTLIKAILQAAGGNGGGDGVNDNNDLKNSGGGGGGEYLEYIIPVSANTAYAYVVGGVGANTTLTVGSVVYSAAFGVTAANATAGSTGGGAGGGRLGPTGGATGTPGGVGTAAANEGEVGEFGCESGASGGGAGNAAASAGGNGGPSGSFLGGAGGNGSFGNGGGGAASRFGPGAAGGIGTSAVLGANGSNAVSTAYGAGGGGAAGGTGTKGTGGTGTGGCIIIIPLD